MDTWYKRHPVMGKSLDPASHLFLFKIFRGIHCFCCAQLRANPITGALSCRGPRTVAGAPPTRFAIRATAPVSPAPVLDEPPVHEAPPPPPHPQRERARCCHVPGSAMCCSLGDHCEALVFVDQSCCRAGLPPLGPARIGPPCTAFARESFYHHDIVRPRQQGR